MAMKPFHLKAQMLRGVCTEPYGIDLAGLLASRLWRQGTHAHTVDSMIERPQDFDLPLDMCGTADDWHWLATCAVPTVDDKHPQEPRTYYRVVNESWMSRVADRPLPYYHPRSSAYRDVMMPSPVTLTPTLSWYGVGDLKKILALVEPIRSIGRRRAKGEGRVLSWSIEQVEEADPWAFGHLGQENRLLRPVPVECAERLGVQYQLAWHAVRPPSWNPNRLRELAVDREEDVYLPEEWEL